MVETSAETSSESNVESGNENNVGNSDCKINIIGNIKSDVSFSTLSMDSTIDKTLATIGSEEDARNLEMKNRNSPIPPHSSRLNVLEIDFLRCGGSFSGPEVMNEKADPSGSILVHGLDSRSSWTKVKPRTPKPDVVEQKSWIAALRSKFKCFRCRKNVDEKYRIHLRLLLVLSFVILNVISAAISVSMYHSSYVLSTRRLGSDIAQKSALSIQRYILELIEVPAKLVTVMASDFELGWVNASDTVATVHQMVAFAGLHNNSKDEVFPVPSQVYTASEQNVFSTALRSTFNVGVGEAINMQSPADYPNYCQYASDTICIQSHNASCIPWNSSALISCSNFKPTSRPWYTKAKTHQKQVWTGPYIFQETGLGTGLGITVSQPFYSDPTNFTGNKKFLGVTAIDYTLSDLQTYLEKVKHSGTAFIVDSRGYLIAKSTGAVNGTVANELILSEKSENEVIREASKHCISLDGGIWKKLEDGEREYKGVKVNGKRYNLYANGVFHVGIQWVLLVATDESEFTRDAQSTAYKVLGVCTAVVFAMICIACVITDAISKPLNKIKKCMERTAMLDFDGFRRDEQGKIMFKRKTRIQELYLMQKSCNALCEGISAFERFLPKAVVERIISGEPHAKDLHVSKRNVTLYFSDIQGFTTISEKLGPEKLIRVLSKYFLAMTSAIEVSGGTIGDFIGDGIMAFWNSPQKVLNHECQACECVLVQEAALKSVNVDLIAEGIEPLVHRVGLHTGRVFSGNIGSKSKLKFGVVGDAVNLASRLEALNKRYETRFLISQETYSKVHNSFVCRPMDIVAVKGRSGSTVLYELMSRNTEATREQLLKQDVFQHILHHYVRRDFAEVERRAMEYLDILGQEDKVATLYIERARHFKQNPPQEDWDGIDRIKKKYD